MWATLALMFTTSQEEERAMHNATQGAGTF